MKRHLAVLTAVLALAGVAACDDDTAKTTPAPATSDLVQPSDSAPAPVIGESKPPLPTPGESQLGPDHSDELFGSAAPTS
ncbi:hypothetical protein ACWKSP_16325 [Micromonosporaceae bacterium Da 78-11]